MARVIVMAALVIFVAVACFAQGNYSDSLTITTYYPAPYGVYKNLRLHPSQEPTKGVDRGVMYFNGTDESIYYYKNNTARWVKLGGGGGNGGKTCVPHQWTESNSSVGATYVVTPNISGSGYLTGLMYNNPQFFKYIVITVDGKETFVYDIEGGLFVTRNLATFARFNSNLQVKFQYSQGAFGAVYYCLEE